MAAVNFVLTRGSTWAEAMLGKRMEGEGKSSVRGEGGRGSGGSPHGKAGRGGREKYGAVLWMTTKEIAYPRVLYNMC
jgi:hypothetical protein